MGGVISTANDFVVNLACSCFCLEVNHICRLDKNLDALEEDMRILKAKRDDVQGRVKRDEDTGLQSFNEVKLWLRDVGTTEKEEHEMRMACISQLQGSSLCEVCSKQLYSRFRYGRKVFSMLEAVNELRDRKLVGDFIVVSGPSTRDVAEERPLQSIVGQETILERAWNHLKNEETKIVGIFGMGGVGKTTLLKQINNKFRVENDGVDVVIWVVVSKDKRNEKVQDEIAEELDLCPKGELWKQKTEANKASSIRNSMKKKRFVLLLDDIWSKVELTDIGVPLPTRENKCKIVFTTRSREVCERMEVRDPMEIKCLESKDAWNLFQSKVGQSTLNSDPDIPNLARKVAEKCRGLPLALNVIGETMSFKKTRQEWRHAVNTLTSSAAKFSEMGDEILPILKYSYDSLKEENVKPCFLYCSLFPEDFEIKKDVLIEYWICEGFIQEKQGRENAFDEGYHILGTLVRACLLSEESIYKVQVIMHDVVREMALWVASDLGKNKEKFIVQAGVGLREIPEVDDWRVVRSMSLMNNEIENISGSPNCHDLTTLLLQNNKMVSISSEFFRCMPRLLVLDLSKNDKLTGLPEQIPGLVALRYLDLSSTLIERLPVGLLESKMLIYLNLESTWRLDSISGVSNFPRLRRLGLLNSRMKLDMSLLKELELLKYLEVVTIGISSCSVAEELLYYPRVVKCIQKVHFKNLEEESFRIFTLPTMENLCDLEIERCGMMEIKTEGAKSSWNKSPVSPCFNNLSTLVIDYCTGLKDLTWLLFAPNLSILNIGRSNQLEYIISEEKAVSGGIIPFRRLEKLSFYAVPMLKSIYWRSLPFLYLKEMRITGCVSLRKLPLDSKSVAKVDGFIIHSVERHWTQSIEWEDDATKLRFQSCFK